MEVTKKGRPGRPVGTGINDARHLDAVADLMIRNPNLKKTTAISKIVQESFPPHKWAAAERRLLRKWNETAEQRMAAGRERRREEVRTRAESGGPQLGVPFPNGPDIFGHPVQAQSFYRQIHDLIDPPFLRYVRRHIEETQRIRDTLDPPGFRQFSEQVEMARRILGDYSPR